MGATLSFVCLFARLYDTVGPSRAGVYYHDHTLRNHSVTPHGWIVFYLAILAPYVKARRAGGVTTA